MRERGLKYVLESVDLGTDMSLPTRERGLKFDKLVTHNQNKTVAPYAGAWIEMLRGILGLPSHRSLPTRERGLK